MQRRPNRSSLFPSPPPVHQLTSTIFSLQHKNIIPVTLDVENLDSIEPALANIGDVDLLVNNAGIAYLADFVDHDVVETERCVACL